VAYEHKQKLALGSYYEWTKSTTVSLTGQMEVWKALKLAVKAAITPEWSPSTGEIMWERRVAMRDGARWREKKCLVCTKMDRVGMAWKDRQSGACSGVALALDEVRNALLL
jgi:hypothetical protein